VSGFRLPSDVAHLVSRDFFDQLFAIDSQMVFRYFIVIVVNLSLANLAFSLPINWKRYLSTTIEFIM